MLAWVRQIIAPSLAASGLATVDRRVNAAIIGIAAPAVFVSIAIAPDMRGAAAAGLAVIMVTIAAIDARRLIIPDELSATAFVLGLVHAAFEDADAWVDAVAAAVLRAIMLALVFMALRMMYRWLRGRHGIGLGDVKLAAVAGAWLDWLMIPIAIEIAALAALAFYLARQFALDRSVRPFSALPFGLFFAPAIWLGWVLHVMPLTRLETAWS